MAAVAPLLALGLVAHPTTMSTEGLPAWVKVPVLAVPQLGSCASSGRAWRLWAARHSQGDRPAHWAPSHCLGCSS